jgi:hypothetical protein
MSGQVTKVPPNQVYYLEVAPGRWTGTFDYHLTSFQNLRRAQISLKNKLLALSMQLFQGVFGRSSIETIMTPHPEQGEAGVCTNEFRIFKWFFPLFHSSETYTLSADGQSVVVDADVHFGPIPFLFRERDHYTALVSDEGMKNVYRIVLLGARFEGDYTVSADRRQVTSRLVNDWATANEVLTKAIG